MFKLSNSVNRTAEGREARLPSRVFPALMGIQ